MILAVIHRVTRVCGLAGVLILLGACSSTPIPTPSASPSVGPTDGAVSGLPPGCEPIDLRSPSGDRVVLDGTWTEVGTAGELMTWRIRTQGNCVWGAGSIEDPPEGVFEGPNDVQSLSGVLGSDRVIRGEIVFLGSLREGAYPTPYSPLRMLVEFDDAGETVLREDRQPGVLGPRCPEPAGFCPAPLVLQPAS